MIGFSFYLSDPNAEERIRAAGNIGVKQAFTSLHIPEESGDMAKKAQKLLNISKNLGIKVFADVSLHTMKHLGISRLQELAALGVYGIRLDDDLEGHDVRGLANTFYLSVNASTLTETELKRLLDMGIEQERLIGWHNYYPRKETGLSKKFFKKQNEMFKKYEIELAAFVPGNDEKRGPLFEGLPTLEDHRYASPYQGAAELLMDGMDHIFIGDPGASAKLLDSLVSLDQNRMICLRIYSNSIKSGAMKLRPDFSRDVLRFVDTRSTENIPPENTKDRPIGTVTMDNDLYGRYRGELQISLTDLPADEMVNVIGSVFEEDLPLLHIGEPGQAIYLECFKRL